MSPRLPKFNPVVMEWIDRAEGDFQTAQREARVKDKPNHNAVCFHAQQSIEKLYKAVLIAREETPPRTHDLATLDRLLAAAHPRWSWPVDELRILTVAAVEYRYPGNAATAKEARASMAICRRLRRALRACLTGATPGDPKSGHARPRG